MKKTLLPPQSATEVAEIIREFLKLHPNAALKEGAKTLFFMSDAQVTIEPRHGRCVLYFWSSDLNLIRTVTNVVTVEDALKLSTIRMNTKKVSTMRLVADSTSRQISNRDQKREAYLQILRQALQHYLVGIDCVLPGLYHSNHISCSRKDAYTRGLVKQGRELWAFIGVGAGESSESRTSLLRSGLCWLEQCRQKQSGNRCIIGLKVIVPKEHALTTQTRMSWLKKSGKWELYELDENSLNILAVSIDAQVPIKASISEAFNHEFVLHRSMGALVELLKMLPRGAAKMISLQPVNATKLSIRLNGLEFASIQHGLDGDSFQRKSHLRCTAMKASPAHSGKERKSHGENDITTLFIERRASGSRTHPYYRNRADMWFCEVLRKHLLEIEPSIQQKAVYCSVESSSAGLCDSIDLLAVSRDGRLMVLNARADANTLFPLHGLDQWLRVRELNRSGELKKAGYFPGISISLQDPLLLFITPALRLHATNESILGFFSSSVEWAFLGMDENWRSNCRVIFRKHSCTGFAEPSGGFNNSQAWNRLQDHGQAPPGSY